MLARKRMVVLVCCTLVMYTYTFIAPESLSLFWTALQIAMQGSGLCCVAGRFCVCLWVGVAVGLRLDCFWNGDWISVLLFLCMGARRRR